MQYCHHIAEVIDIDAGKHKFFSLMLVQCHQIHRKLIESTEYYLNEIVETISPVRGRQVSRLLKDEKINVKESKFNEEYTTFGQFSFVRKC